MASKTVHVTTYDSKTGIPHTTTVARTDSSGSSSSSSSGGSGSSSGQAYDANTVSALNTARAAAAAAGRSTTDGNLKDYATFAASQSNGAGSQDTEKTGTSTTGGATTGTAGSQRTYTGQDGYLYYEGSNGQKAPDTQESIYNRYLKQNSGLIDSVNATFDSEIADAKKTAADTEENSNAYAAASGLGGSSASIESAFKNSNATDANVKGIQAQRLSQIADVMNKIQTTANTQFNTEREDTDTENIQKASDVKDHVTALAQAEVDWDKFKDTPEYKTLLNQAGGDANYLDALYTLGKPQGTIDTNLSKVIGNTYYQVTRDPVTGKMSSSSFEVPYDVPKTWTFQKIGTNSGIFYDPTTYNPSDPSTYKNVYTDPFTGAVTDGSSSSSGDDAANSTGGSAARNIQKILPPAPDGSPADMSQPLTQAIQTYGITSLAQAMVQNEGGSPEGVENNPGNIKYTGAPGQTDSGVKATDGGTFASYKTPDDGLKQIENLITNAASGKSAAYGASPTLAGFIGKYTNTGTTTPDTKQYGLLANVSDFNPSNPIDSAASNYLNEYLSQGKVPTAASVGISTRTGSGAAFNTIADRANALYTAATGQSLPDATQLATNKKLIAGNNSILNNLNIQEPTIQQNAALLEGNLTAANLNQNAPAINNIIDGIKNSLGNADTASLIAQSSTIQNELGSLLALKNASGTTVHDKLEAAGLIDKSYNAEQIAAVVNTLMKEAQNGRAALNIANAKLYQQTDPLQKNSNNPLSTPANFFSSVGIDYSKLKQDNPGVSDQELVNSFLSQH